MTLQSRAEHPVHKKNEECPRTLSRPVDRKLTDLDYEPKEQEFGCTLSEDLSHTENLDNIHHVFCPDIMLITIVQDQENTELKEISALQNEDTNCKHIINSTHICSSYKICPTRQHTI